MDIIAAPGYLEKVPWEIAEDEVLASRVPEEASEMVGFCVNFHDLIAM